MTSLFLDIHALQTLPPSCLNRDDTGSPKTCLYGGVERSRVSSQCWKKAMRDYFRNHIPVGLRTLNTANLLKDALLDQEHTLTDEEALTSAETILKQLGLKVNNKHQTDALFFISPKQLQQVAKVYLEDGDVKDLKKAILDCPSLDMALFGRMVAADPALNLDASCQVAHVISTHETKTQYDFYTALDDSPLDSQSGAAMLDTTEFNASTVYRYATIALHDLKDALGDDLDRFNASVDTFIDAFVKALPTGKTNSFAPQSFPEYLLISLRTDRPVSLVTAFESPVKAKDGYLVPSIEALNQELDKAIRLLDPAIGQWALDLTTHSPNKSVNTFSDLKELTHQEIQNHWRD